MGDMPNPADLERLRGALASEEPGARGIEHVTRNPSCTRLVALTASGVKPATAADKVYGKPAREGQSPFALLRGNRFEEVLLENNAQRLFDLYAQAGRLGEGQRKVLNVAAQHPATDPESLKAREELTLKTLQAKLDGEDAPNLIVKPRVRITMLGVPYALEPDVLVASDEDPFYRVMEIKSYPDRGGMTDTMKTAGACRQSAVGVVALRQRLADRLGREDAVDLLPAECDLVFARPGSNWPTLHPMRIAGEVDELLALLDSLDATMEEVLRLVGEGTLESDQTLNLLPHAPCGACREHCALWEVCREQAAERGDPVLLGDGARELLAGVGDLRRAVELRDGAEPADEVQELAATLLREATSSWREALDG